MAWPGCGKLGEVRGEEGEGQGAENALLDLDSKGEHP